MEGYTILISEVLSIAERLGFRNVTPMILSDAGNLIVHLAPYKIVARVAKLFESDDPNLWREIGSHEVKVSQHLMDLGIPVIPCSSTVPPGPHKVGDTWMTLWEYVEPVSLSTLNGEQVIVMVNDLVKAMSDFQEPLPPLGVWRNVNQAADYLRSQKSNASVAKMLLEYEPVNERMQSETLYPAHGDAHRGNLLSSATGWLWSDFEDVSLMPKFWDLASFIGNTLLFRGLKHPVVQFALQSIMRQDQSSFQFALKARVIMAPMTNLALALNGHGDLDFAKEQLDLANDFLPVLNNNSLWD